MLNGAFLSDSIILFDSGQSFETYQISINSIETKCIRFSGKINNKMYMHVWLTTNANCGSKTICVCVKPQEHSARVREVSYVCECVFSHSLLATIRAYPLFVHKALEYFT